MTDAIADPIVSIAQLEATIGAPPLGVKMKIIDHLDDAAADWIAQSTLAFIGIGKPDGPRITLAGGNPGFARRTDEHTLTIPLEALDDPDLAQPGEGAGVLCLVPGIGETLRANGRVKSRSNAAIEITIEECFIHCAKSLIRSAFWEAQPAQPPADPTAFVNATRFLALATMDKRGLVDISPKGDPASLLIRLDATTATLAERPGNKLAFGYRNIIEQPRAAMLALIPGANTTAHLTGNACLTTDEATRAAFTVEEKTPKLATILENVAPVLRPSPALQRAAPWSDAQPTPTIDPAATFVAHVKLNKEKGVAATMMRLAVNRGLVEAGLKTNYKNELY
ncbi:MAG TPA: pyridoxamine 5'-phosphate oxidase family protein [Hyphomonadaceae bacterium]|nr:pyridoxamine 5'-phosphate oxidase family protein [Hyphomonadaceae bacterium]HPN06549.1 pyridoxamine 5'-phosphate oxidase family protein [Hyphomonadaceae bacterium]